MSLYNLVNGVNQATFFILPMLNKHPDDYPRFRDCFVGRMTNSDENDDFGIPKKKLDIDEEKREISVYTRVGGGNRDSYEEEIKKLRAMPEYVTDYDDDFDETFATFIFKVPEKWGKDFDLILAGKITETSKEYQNQLKKVFPKLKEKFEEIFNPNHNQQEVGGC